MASSLETYLNDPTLTDIQKFNGLLHLGYSVDSARMLMSAQGTDRLSTAIAGADRERFYEQKIREPIRRGGKKAIPAVLGAIGPLGAIYKALPEHTQQRIAESIENRVIPGDLEQAGATAGNLIGYRYGGAIGGMLGSEIGGTAGGVAQGRPWTEAAWDVAWPTIAGYATGGAISYGAKTAAADYLMRRISQVISAKLGAETGALFERLFEATSGRTPPKEPFEMQRYYGGAGPTKASPAMEDAVQNMNWVRDRIRKLSAGRGIKVPVPIENPDGTIRTVPMSIDEAFEHMQRYRQRAWGANEKARNLMQAAPESYQPQVPVPGARSPFEDPIDLLERRIQFAKERVSAAQKLASQNMIPVPQRLPDGSVIDVPMNERQAVSALQKLARAGAKKKQPIYAPGSQTDADLAQNLAKRIRFHMQRARSLVASPPVQRVQVPLRDASGNIVNTQAVPLGEAERMLTRLKSAHARWRPPMQPGKARVILPPSDMDLWRKTRDAITDTVAHKLSPTLARQYDRAASDYGTAAASRRIFTPDIVNPNGTLNHEAVYKNTAKEGVLAHLARSAERMEERGTPAADRRVEKWYRSIFPGGARAQEPGADPGSHGYAGAPFPFPIHKRITFGGPKVPTELQPLEMRATKLIPPVMAQQAQQQWSGE
jgi:hypothetical protein